MVIMEAGVGGMPSVCLSTTLRAANAQAAMCCLATVAQQCTGPSIGGGQPKQAMVLCQVNVDGKHGAHKPPACQVLFPTELCNLQGNVALAALPAHPPL
jgi:hypothetical protein